MSAPLRVRVEGIALWAPRLPGWEAARAILRGEAPAPDAPLPRPAPTMLAPTERRRAPDTVALALEVAQAACAAAGRDPKALASVFASTHGDLAISDYMCAELALPQPAISPTKFHNSVHNAGAGYWTIGTGCMAPSTALTAWHGTFAMGLLEAATQVHAEGEPVLLVAYDIEARGPMATVTHSRGLFGVALVLGPAGATGPGPRLALAFGGASGREPSAARPGNAALVDGNALAGALPLFEAMALAQPARITLAAGRDSLLDTAWHP
ncbi:MAG TPA: beta-ketoacyl synthase chain length factor [Pseudomonadota bacterium]|nr:beta-ketoacyl synthase chain length factor [Xanthomonadales bacterium]HQY36647.1 beta-ketoacyl synthase chain length factor [Pseudomonadota bacterium]HRA37642.1 beta-ketoacyl synthase chain length factor [Pseudomonadota bacterium]